MPAVFSEPPPDDDLDLVSASELLVEDLESDESAQAPKQAFISRSSEHSLDEMEIFVAFKGGMTFKVKVSFSLV